MKEILRKRRDDEGFTLIELMVVVLIIAILIAIAIPTFLGARSRAQDRAAQSNIRNAFTAEKVYYTDNQVYTDTTANLSAIEPSLTFVQASSATSASVVGQVHVKKATTNGTDDSVYVSARSASGTCFYLKDVSSGTGAGTKYARDTACGAATGELYTTAW